MTLGEIAVLSLIIAAFLVFGVTLAWVSRDARTTDRVSRRITHDPTAHSANDG